MSQVHKADRGESRFEVMDHAVVLKNKLRELSILRNFGYKARESKPPRNFDQWSEKSRERWKQQEEARLKKLEWLDKHFLMDARKAVDDDIRRMMHGISAANSIKRPSSMAEADERRIHQDRAIAACEDMRIDLQDIMDTLPIDKNWMTHIEPEIASQIALLKAWRKSDNEMRRAIREADAKRWLKFLQKCVVDGTESELLKGIYHAFLNSVERRELDKKDMETPNP